MCRDYEAIIDMSTASNGYDRSSLIDLNSKDYGANALRQRFDFFRFCLLRRAACDPLLTPATGRIGQ
jgi:hypothetical protein